MITVSLRVPLEVVQKINKWVRLGKKQDRSTAARELMEYGWMFILLEHYREGKVSLGKLARELDLSISETMDFLAQHNIQAHLDFADYLKGLESVRKVF